MRIRFRFQWLGGSASGFPHLFSQAHTATLCRFLYYINKKKVNFPRYGGCGETDKGSGKKCR